MTITADETMRLYVWGYPLVYCTDEIAKLTDGRGTLLADRVGFNEFGYARALLGPDAEFVSPNNDTLYLVAPLDVGGGPVLLRTPDTQDRYYVLQFVDPWTNNFAYIGKRASGTGAGDWLLAPAGYDADVPAGATLVELPNRVAVIVGRVQVDGEADLPAVHALQDRFTLEPLGSASAEGIPTPAAGVAPDVAFWEQLRTYLQAFPPPPEDAEFLELAERAGLLDPEPFAPDAELAAALAEGIEKGKGLVESIAGGANAEPGTWTSAKHMFDYNLDRCGPGTVDDPAWKIADRTTAYVTRAVAARAGLWGNHGYEADYEIVHQDADGEQLDGAHRYTVRFDPPPPADAFWSLTMYDVPRYYLVDNPIGRYSIGDRTPGLTYDEDGAVTILLQHEQPEGELASNWLPAPAGAFRPILRMYQPGPSVLDGTYAMPKIQRAG